MSIYIDPGKIEEMAQELRRFSRETEEMETYLYRFVANLIGEVNAEYNESYVREVTREINQQINEARNLAAEVTGLLDTLAKEAENAASEYRYNAEKQAQTIMQSVMMLSVLDIFKKGWEFISSLFEKLVETINDVGEYFSRLNEEKREIDNTYQEEDTYQEDIGNPENIPGYEREKSLIQDLEEIKKNIPEGGGKHFLELTTSELEFIGNLIGLSQSDLINWAKAPKGGYVLDNAGNAIKYEYTPRVGEVIDRYGPPNGRYTSPIVDGIPYDYDQRALPFIEDSTQYHKYEVTGDISKLQEYVSNCKDANLKAEIEGYIDYYFNGDYSKIVTYKGTIASVDGWGNGGGIQYELPIKIEYLEKLGILKEIF